MRCSRGVLDLVFRVADDNGWLLLDLDDLRAMLKFVADKKVPSYGEVMGRPHDIYHLIFFNPSQIGLITMEHHYVIFLNDYGAGTRLIKIKDNAE